MLLAHAEAVSQLAKQYDIEPAVLLAVIDVESNGAEFGPSGMPIIRWEGHYFDRLVPAHLREEARKAGLAHPTAGKIKNPASQADRYAILAKAMKIDPAAALSSISMGVGQVMGSHWEKLGFTSVVQMFDMARTGYIGQVELMVRYIVAFGLLDELKRYDWSAFARAYNGKNYAAGGYHTLLKAAYLRLTGMSPVPASDGMVRMGSKGIAVREVQQLLARAGLAVKVDSDFGPSTRDAVHAFQLSMGIEADGVVGPETMAKLNTFRTSPDEAVGNLKVTEINDVKEAVVVGTSGAGGLVVLEQTLTKAADKIGTMPGLEMITQGLTIAAVVVSLAAVAYGMRGWMKAKA